MTKELIKRILSTLFLIPVSFYIILEGAILFNFFLLVCFVFTLYEWHKMSFNKKYYFIGYIFLFFSFYSAYILRNNLMDISGLFNFLLIIIICISTDIGGYIVGNIFRGPKLNKISPNKTYSGMLGGYILSLMTACLFVNFSEKLFDLKVLISVKMFTFIFLVSTVSQVGDIIVSYFKRLSKIKDTGKLIPGHGGILDRIDGMIFAFPFATLILQLGIII